MRYPTASAQLQIFVSAATLAAHASSDDSGFRQRDVRFFAELFLNWAEDIGGASQALQNTQVLRHLEGLVKEGYSRKVRGKSAPTYRLTRLGLLEEASRLTRIRESTSASQFLFVVSFLRSYGERIERLVEREGKQFPLSLKLELKALLDTEALLSGELQRVIRAISRLERRIADSEETSALCRRRAAAGVPFGQVVEEVEERYPYELNTQRPLSELISGIAPDQRRWELEEGTLVRSRNIWVPQLALLKEYRLQLQGLIKPGPKSS